MFSAAYFDKLKKCITISRRDGRLPRGPWASGSLGKAMEFAHTYRKLVLKDLSFLDRDNGKNGKEVIQFIRKLGFYIKTLVIDLDYRDEHLNMQYTKFNVEYVTSPILKELLASMTKLETLVLVDRINQLDSSSYQISEILAVLPPNTKIAYIATNLLQGPGRIIPISAGDVINAKQNYDPYHVKIVLQSLTISSQEQLHYLATNWLDKSKIPCVQIHLTDDNFTNQNNVKEDMNKFLISCGCKYLALGQQAMTFKWNLAASGDWRKQIVSLLLLSYSHPLLHFQEFPKLRQLELTEVDVNACLFSDQTKTQEENLKAVLNGFMKKNRVRMYCSYFTGSPMFATGYQFIGPGTPLYALMRASIRQFAAFQRQDLNIIMNIQ